MQKSLVSLSGAIFLALALSSCGGSGNSSVPSINDESRTRCHYQCPTPSPSPTASPIPTPIPTPYNVLTVYDDVVSQTPRPDASPNFTGSWAAQTASNLGFVASNTLPQVSFTWAPGQIITMGNPLDVMTVAEYDCPPDWYFQTPRWVGHQIVVSPGEPATCSTLLIDMTSNTYTKVFFTLK